jgi:hypothetical protein
MSKIILALLIAFSTMASVVNAQENEIQNTPPVIEVEEQETQLASVSPMMPVQVSVAVTEVAEPPRIIEYGKFTQDQIKLLRLAYDVGSEYGHPETAQAILLQESSAGAGGRESGFGLPLLDHCFGVMQMKVAAVLDVLKTYPSLISRYFFEEDPSKIKAKEIIKKLKNDDEFSIRMSVNYYKKYYEGNLAKAVMSYNAGPGGVLKLKHPERHPYMQGVKKHLATVKDFNRVVKEYTIVAVEGDNKP